MNLDQKKPKIVVIVGPTSSGKSAWAVKIAKRFHGEVISVDSRQVYGGIDLASGKISEDEMNGIPHHLLSVVLLEERFSVAQYKEMAETVIESVLSRGNLPILTGGTGFYIDSIVHNTAYPEVPPNTKLRRKLDSLTTKHLFDKLLALDPRRAKTIDPSNKVRLIRAIEIAETLGKVPQKNPEKKYDALQIGISVPLDELRKKIAKRTDERLRSGMIEEARNLYENSLSLKRMKELGLDLRILAEYLEGSISEPEIRELIIQANYRYAKRQMTWFRRDREIQWYKEDEFEKACEAINYFLHDES